MTTFSIIQGVVPLVRATGAGEEMRFTLGVAVFGIVFTPVFFYVIRRWTTPKTAAVQPIVSVEQSAS